MNTDSSNDIVAAAKELGKKVDSLSAQLTFSRTQIERNNRNTKTLYIIFGLMTAIIVVLTFTVKTVSDTADDVQTVADNNGKQADCVARWADQFTKRSNLITTLGIARTDALDKLVRTFTLSGDNQSQQFSQALAVYLQASDNYSKALTSNPIPQSPVFNCG